MSRFQTIQAKCPTYPKDSCPQIDDAVVRVRSTAEDTVGTLEELRHTNQALRANATYWRDKVVELLDEIAELEETLEAAQAEIAEQ